MPQHDLIVIGAGPGGYVAAIRAAQLGKNVACIEQEPLLGGTCLRVGCIPSKAMLESSHLYEEVAGGLDKRGIKTTGVKLDLPEMLRHKERVVQSLGGGVDALFKKNKITRYFGHARIDGPGRVVVTGKDGNEELTAAHILIATGSKPATLPGIELDGDRIGSSTEALSYDQVPPHLVVIGAGYIGLEMGTVWRRLGAQVTVLEYLDRILPGMDSELARDAKKLFEKQGLTFQLGCKVTGVKLNRKTCDVQIEGADPIRCDKVLVAVGRKPNTDDLGLDSVNVETDHRGFIAVNGHYQTGEPTIYAIGDVIGGAMLAHKAEEEGVACVEQMYTGYGHVNYDTIPGVVYTEPEIATVGKTEDALKEAGIPYRKGTFPFIANSRARASGHTDGKVKILAHKETDRVLGVHIIGPHAGELIAEAAVSMEFGASSEDIARCCHAHPTLAEAVKEAALAVDKRSINS
ncbi:Dihydrolipoyl dehydrogenase 3 [Maioricimonas rarisocia]|uniref:Dihydrolipoyl dehydrogenase n=1 Tax=Maioricimonas rarisocia TaxID=2528026 RepID=A0A517Z7B1_9PLAN|nr:dihydrolipoyl dehydrogenase [Maioricimonas rarisocia]QDU38365.1 Dihydrolipoyl dehydrogenase 3 [Maioricimonas rarisocia]